VGRALRRSPGLGPVTATVGRPAGSPVPMATSRGQAAQLATGLQIAARISFPPVLGMGPIAGFGVLRAVGARLLVRLLRAVPTSAPAPTAGAADVHVHG
jgi:hypothetical protein